MSSFEEQFLKKFLRDNAHFTAVVGMPEELTPREVILVRYFSSEMDNLRKRLSGLDDRLSSAFSDISSLRMTKKDK